MKCRLCNCEELKDFLSLNDQPPANAFLKKEDFNNERIYPLELTFCKKCLLVQLTDQSFVKRDNLFLNYAYASSISGGLRNHFNEFAHKLKESFPNANSVVDIGSNDGILLDPLLKLGFNAIGIEPASNLASIANKNGLVTICSYFEKETVEKIIDKIGNVDIITASNVFAHLDNYHDFIENVKLLLKEDGIFIFEVQYFADMLKELTFDNIYHEHVMYYTLHSIVNLFQVHKMNIIDVERIPTHGGSIRVYVSKNRDRTHNQDVLDLLQEEKSNQIDNFQIMKEFSQKLDTNIQEIKSLVNKIRKEDKTIFGYGAPAKSSTIINSIGLNNKHIELIIEDSPLKQGLFTPGSHIPITSPDILLERKPDYLMIFAWNYADEIIKKIEEKYSKINYIIPMPELKIIKNKD